MNRKSPIIIGIAGGTGSGKSTFTNRLKDAFGDQVTVLYHDNYYRAHDDMPFEQRKKLNYDHPDAFETELLLEHLNKLKNWEAIDCPTYNYANHNRAEATIHIEPRPVILLEGILVLYDEALRNLLDIRIFVDADADERILRRILRDTKERGRDIENIIDQYLTTVKPMHALFVEPTRAYADVVTNSGRNEVAFSLVRGEIARLLEEAKAEEYYFKISGSLRSRIEVTISIFYTSSPTNNPYNVGFTCNSFIIVSNAAPSAFLPWRIARIMMFFGVCSMSMNSRICVR